MAKFKGIFLVALLVLFISACGGTPDPVTPTAKLTLTPASGQVVSGNTVVLTATIDEGAENVATVEFAIKDQPPAFATDDGSDGSYTATSAALSANTIFVATAKDSAGTVLGSSNEVTVTVTAPPAQPNAEAKTVTTLAGVQVVGGTTPTGLAVVTEKLVVQNGTAAIKGTATGGTVTLGTDGSFTFTPSDGATSGSFEYEVTSNVSGTKPDSALVTINITALPANTIIASTLAAINAASEGATILWAGEIICDADNDPSDEANCILLKANQKLLGGGEVAGVTVNNPNAKLRINLPDGSITGSITGIKLAPGVTVEGLEISGEGTELYTAINGNVADFDTNPAPDVITPAPGNINIKNVKIIGPTSNAPLAMRLGTAPVGSYYNLTIDGLELTNATNTIGLSAFNNLEITNSTIAMNINSNTRGLFIAAEGASTALIDNVDISSVVAGETFTPMFIANGSGGGVLNVTVKNSDITFPEATPAQLNVARSFGFDYENNEDPPRGGRIVINTAESTNNTSEGNGAVTYEAEAPNTAADKITGYIQGDKPSVFVTR